MAIDRNKVAEAAQKFSLKGQYTKAIAELQKIVAEDNNDVRTLQRIAELYLKANNPGDAVRTYAEVALIYEAGGFFAKAVAVYRQVIKLSPDETEAKIRLANLYHQTGMLSDALLLFDQVSQAYLQAGDPGSYLTILTRMVELDPDHVGNRIRLAEQYAEDKLMLPAREHFNAAADTLHRTRRLDEFVKVAERLLIHFPDDDTRHRQLIRALTETQRGARAIPRIQRLLERDPHDADALELLIEARVSMGEKGRAVAILRELAVGYHEDGHRELEERVLRRILALDPNDEAARASLSLQNAAAKPAEARGSLSGDEFERQMSEVDVFLKYNLYDRATDHLRQLLKADPSNQRVIRRKVEVHKQAGQDQAAVREIVRLARLIIEEDLDRAASVVAEADAIVPGHLDVREFENKLPHSGTPFRQILESGAVKGTHLVQFGAREGRNARAHFDYCKKEKVAVHEFAKIRGKGDAIKQFKLLLANLAKKSDAVALTIDMDCCEGIEGVSAAPVIGFSAWELCQFARLAGANKKITMLELAEIAPDLDPTGRAARIGAEILFHFVLGRIGV